MNSINIKDTIQDKLIAALKSHQTERLSTLRLLLAAIKEKEIEKRTQLNNIDIICIIEKQINQRLESIQEFTKANRELRVIQEKNEILVLEELLPNQASEEEINQVINNAILVVESKGINGKASIGETIKIIKKELIGRVNMSAISKKIHELFSNK
ncbi:GatB/YqeY domain-containing protein [Candidatus Kinetoplastidibacterium crithidiae]|uniref:Yqey-like protein n=1 Tax=Candidatus Kinetoplastidibacterium crithidiae TCC036E TaxID=1208918 RepID=M1LPE6_9PROT|nr:GatB/YqeY domain-containing protein [Candidatus Kinetoplastibacterium crithidii]AFZ82800.1 Yqey-like family protein [Candidatus Kinetoplastibacterium crithidii (ex Angomonas deanei ATCC 30255)]AGF47547.1 Yqey-like protein [Candidatus Kinetoplastibacterium crithidii TCC036E]